MVGTGTLNMASSDEILEAIKGCQVNYNQVPNSSDPDENGPNWHLELLSVLHQIRIELKNSNNLNAMINNIKIR
jgi:hypothetical protein